MRLITLTAPDGTKFEIDPEKISVIEPAHPGLFYPGTKTVLRVDGEMHAVIETVAQIDQLRKETSS